MTDQGTPMQFSAEGVLLDPPVHDGYLESVKSRDGVLELGVLRYDKSVRFKLCFPGIEALVCNTFLEGNIVFDVVYCKQVDGGGFGSFLAGFSLDVLKTFEIYYGSPERFKALLTLGSSYGAEILAAGDISPGDCYYRTGDLGRPAKSVL